MSDKNHTPLVVDTLKNIQTGNRKLIADILFFSLGMLTAVVFVAVFSALVDNRTISFLQR